MVGFMNISFINLVILILNYHSRENINIISRLFTHPVVNELNFLLLYFVTEFKE
jgi:hypothetical protein